MANTLDGIAVGDWVNVNYTYPWSPVNVGCVLEIDQGDETLPFLVDTEEGKFWLARHEIEFIPPTLNEGNSTVDLVNHPSHYADGYSNGAEVIDIVENLNFNRGNAVKYLARAGKKDADTEVQDILKAQFYINRELTRMGAQGD